MSDNQEGNRLSSDDVQKIMNKLDTMSADISDIKKNMNDMSQQIALNADRLTWMETSVNAMRVTAALYAPPQQPVGPTGGYLTEPPSRWKQTWYFAR